MRGKFFFNKHYSHFLTTFFWKKKHPEKFLEYKKFKKMIKNKRVCIVGPAEYIEKEFENHGKIIDSYDIVVRMNNFINMDKSLYKNYGQKIDILMTSLFPGPAATYHHEEAYSYEKIPKPLLIFHQFGRLRKLYFSFFLKNNNITICEQPKENFDEIVKLTKNPTTGMMAILECLKCIPKELFITGLTFGRDEKYFRYIDNYFKYYETSKINQPDKRDYAGHHNLKREFCITKDLILKNNNITIDNYLRDHIFYLEKKEN